MTKIEKALAAAVEPLVDDLIALEKRVNEVSRTPGPQGPQGPEGKPGEPGRDADPDAVAERIKADKAFQKAVEGPQGPKGDPGQDVDSDEVVSRLKADEELRTILKGEKGEQGERGEKGDPGRDGISPDPEELVDLLKGTPDFIMATKGEKGDPGERGPEGEPGAGIFTKSWEKGIHREGTVVNHYSGRTYRAKNDTADEPGDSDDWERVGNGGFRWRGVKSKHAAYEDGDIYVDDRSAFLWMNGKGHLFAGRGQKGDDGRDGVDGKNAPVIVAVKADSDSLVLGFDDGSVVVGEVDGITELITDHVALNVKEISWFERLRQEAEEERVTPLTRYRDVWRESESYLPGDVVKYMQKLYLCVKATKGERGIVGVSSEYWTLLAGQGGGGASATSGTLPLNPLAGTSYLTSTNPGGALNWGKITGLIQVVLDAAERNALPPTPGLVAIQTDDNSMWRFGPGPAGMMWMPIMRNAPALADQYSVLTWDPQFPDRIQWEDARDLPMTVVDQTAMLAIPATYLQVGKLVYQRQSGFLYEFIGNAAFPSRTMADWKVVGANSVRVANREADLPDPNTLTPRPSQGDLAFVRQRNDAVTPYNQLFAVRGDSPAVGTTPLVFTVTGLNVPGGAVDVQITGGPAAWDGVIVMYAELEGTFEPFLDFTVSKGDTPAQMVAAYVPMFQPPPPEYTSVTAVAPDTIRFQMAPGRELTALNPTPGSLQAVNDVNRATLQWVPVSQEITTKPGRVDPDPIAPHERDVCVTMENGHKEIKIWRNGAWVTVYSEDQIQAWIAAGNLFVGTAEETGHGVAGAIDLNTMPAQTALGAVDKGHYWTWVGTSGYVIPAAGIGGQPSAIDGQLLNVGDWIQVAEPNPGVYQYTVIPGDLLAKARGDAIYGLHTWVDGAYEQGTLIVWNGKVYRATAPVVLGNPAPDAPGAPWTAIQLSAGVHNVPLDNNLPANAPAGDVYLVINSQRAGNNPAFYTWDAPTAQWIEVGGGAGKGIPMTLTGGQQIINIGVPVGTILMWPGVSAPHGYFMCTGEGYDPAMYPQLFAVLGKNTVPDLRGQFIRGLGATNLDMDFPKHQWTTGMPRNPLITDEYDREVLMGGGGERSNCWKSGDCSGNMYVGTHSNINHRHRIVGGDAETAPDHVIMAFIIKADDVNMIPRP